MKIFLTVVALLFLAVQIHAQTKPVAYSPLSRTITISSNTFLLNQRLPACSEVYYRVTDLSSVQQGDLFTVLYVPITDANTPAPSSTVTVELLSGSISSNVALPVSSVISDVINGTTYLSTSSCSFTDTVVERSSGNAGSGCGINYYCSGIDSSITGLVIRIATTGNENTEGILFNLSIRRTRLTIGSLTLSTPLTVTSTVSSGVNYFKPTMYQKHYKVYVGPAGSSITNYADFLTLYNPMTELVFSLSNLKVNGVTPTSSQGLWSLNVYLDDIAQADASFMLGTDPSEPCVLYQDVDSAFYSVNTELLITVDSCLIQTGNYFISVGMPNDLSSSFTFDLLVDITDKDAVEDYIPTYQTLTSGTPINDIIGDYALSEALEQNVYLINLAKSAYKAGQYFFVTVYGVDLGSIEFEVTQGCYGFNSGCSACSVIAECNAVTRSKDTGLDYCKVKVDPCTLNVNDATPYFVTVRGTGIDSRFVTYSILYELMSTTPVDITTFKTTTGSNYVEYTYSGSVAEQDYNHFSLAITASSISEFHLLSAHLYVNQEQNEVIFSHNVDSLAGSAEFDTNYNGTDYTVYGPYDSCYDYDYSCNSYLKFGYDYNDSDQIGSCNLQIPYCEILSGSTHYFSVYALNISPNSDYNLNNFQTLYPDGLGYARSVDYTFVVRLWNSAQPLTLNQVINEHVLAPSTLDYYSSNLVDSQYSHQYVFELPTVSSGSYIDTVRVRVDDVTGSSDIVVFVGCGSPAGPCPCYKYDYSCTVGPNDEYRFCQVGIPVCACEGPYYVSIYPLDATASPAATYFTITVYADIAQSLQTVVPSATTTKISTRLLPNNNNFDDIPQNSAYYGYTVVGGTTVVYYAGDLYTISVPSTPSSSSSLQIKLRYSHIPGKSYFDSTRMVMALGNNESVPPANPALANCSQNCVVQPGYSYCSITLNPCEYTAGNHFVRIYGVGYTTYIAPDELDMTDFFGMEYTLEVVEVSNTPMSVTLGTPFRDTITQSKYNHYQVSIPSSTTSSALRFSIYRNSNQNGELGLFYNPTTLAGYEPCYTADRHCFLENDIASMCEVILAPCDVASLSGTTVYFSVATPPDQREILEYPYYYGIVEGDKNLEYTVLAQLVGVTTLDLTKGNPLTANLLYRHEAYYSFTISSTDISAGKIFNLQVQSLETEPNYDSVDTLKITISQNAPGSSVAGDCPCGDIVFTNTFRTQTFPCDLLGNAGTYYVNVRALDYGLPNVLDPVSYTIRAWYTTPISQTLSLSSSWTVAPHPLDFEEIVAYKISYTPRADTILVVEIADITNTRDSSLASGLNAYLSVNYPSAVLTPAYDSLFVGSDSGCNYFDSCDPSNELSEELAAGTVMCNFVVTPCIQCSSVSTYYVTIVPELLQPEPLVQFRLNYTIRAYTKTITTLNNYPSNARTNALASGGYSFSLQETVNPNITCENRFTTNPFFNDFYFKLSSITVNQYEILEYSNDVSNPSNILYTFNDGVAPDYIFNDCGCDSLSGQACAYTSGCSLGSQSITTYGVVGYVEGCPSGPLSSNANGLSFTTEILNQYDYTQLSSVSATINRVYNGTLTEGQFIIYSISVSSVNFNLLPTGGFDFTFSNGDVNSRTCVSFSDPLTSGSGVVFPGSASSSSSYCSLCSPAPTTDFLGCCVDPTSVYYITIYNPFGSGQSMTYTFEAFVDYAATSFTQLSALPISTSVTSVSPTLPALFSFDITAANMNEDDVVNMRFTSTNGTATVYFNNLYFAHPDNLCADFYYQCSTNNADDCVIQVPYCYFVSVANTGSTYQSYYLAIISAESGNFVGPVSINIAVQRTTSFSIPTTTALTNTIPDTSFVPVGYLQHYKFKFTRSVGDQLLNDNDVALTIQLNPGTSANNTLQISIHDPRLSTTSTNVLAGDLTSSFATGSCSYNTDSNWLCYRVSTGITGATTRTTDGATDGVVCYLYFCDNGDMEATVNQLLANEYIYVSVQNLATSGRVPTSYSINASVTSIPLASSETTYKLVPAHTSTDVIYNTTCTAGTSSTTGGCFFAASSTITTAYFSIDLSGVGSWAINDYLLVNITNLVGNNIVITSWSSDECEPSSATSDLTCTSGNDCVLDSDPCRFGALYRSDNGANSYKVIPRNGYLRISGITTGTTFNIAVLQVSPLQITTTLTASSPSYTNTFQMWDYRWALFNFVVPKDEQHHLQITIDSDCTNGANVPEVYLNEYTYQWASKECSEFSDNTPFSWTHYSCDPAGNVFVSVYTPASTLKYDPIAIAEGSYSPQVKFTITATLVSVVTVNDYSWECDLAFAEAATYNVLALGDNENYGTGLSISLVNPNADASIKIISPLWREQVNYTTGFVDGDFLNSFYYTEDGACTSPSCTDVGVYCCSDDTDCIINIPPCEYRNGRYFMVVDVPTTAVLSSTIYRQDYNIIQVGNTPVSLSGSLPIGLISGTNMDLHYYQYYKLELVGQPQLLYVDAYLSFQTYAAWFLDTYKSFINSDLTFSNLPTLTVSLVRGENAWIGEGCVDLSCSDTLPGCGIVETQCVSDVYYLAVWYERNDANYNCNSLPFEITIHTQYSEITTIEPNTVICGTIENYDIFEYYFGGSTTLKRDLFDYSVPYVRDNLDYPFINTYYLDTTSVSDFSDITVRLEVFPVFKGQDLLLTVSTSEIPSYACSDCSHTTDVTNGVTVIEFSIGCGNFTDLWISVESTLSEGRFETDYTLEVMVNEYTIYTPTIPTLTSGIPSTVSVTVSDSDSIINFSSNNGARALVRSSEIVYSADTTNTGCSGGCTVAESGCTFLASLNNYYVYESSSFSAATYCFQTGVTTASVSLEVQSVNSLIISSSSVVSFSASVYGSNYQLIIATLPSPLAAASSYMFSFSDSPDGSVFNAYVGCTGFTIGTSCVNSQVFTFSSDAPATVSSSSLCGCSELYIAVSAATCGNNANDFTITVDPTSDATVATSTSLTAAVWTADTIATFANSNLYNLYTVQASSSGFVHVAVANVNNTAGPNFHSVNVGLYTSSGCLLDSCVTGTFAHMSIPARDGNDADESCYVYSTVGANELVYVQITPNEAAASFPAAGITYRIKPTIVYTDLETTSSQNFQIRGYDRHYYKVNGRASGSAANDIQSVVIDLQIIDGDRLNIYVADSTAFADNSNYAGWTRVKTCYFGLCTVEIPTRAQHPGANVFYVWVETVSTNTVNDERLEKPTNYKISATTGTNNCKSGSNLVSGFCSSIVSTLSSVYNYRDLTARNNEAECRYENLLCGCTHSLATCQTNLKRFSCLESFRECDASGFWSPICRSECHNVETSCGTFAAQFDQCDDCSRPEFNCLSPRYADDGSCSGVSSPSASPTPSITPSTSFTSSPTPSISITPTVSPSPVFGNPDSASPSPSPATGGNNIIIIVEESSSSTLLVNTFLVVLAFLFFNF